MVSRSRLISGFATGVLLLAGVTPASAQPKCADINDGSPFQLAGAKQYLGYAAAAHKADEVPKHLFNAIKVLTDDPAKINNEGGRQFLLLRVYAQYLQQPNVAFVAKRGTLGFTTNPTGTQNLLMAVDTTVKALNQLAPKCVSVFASYRNKFFGDLLNASIAAMNADKLDSAKHYANTALVLAPDDPRAWNVLFAAYQKQQQEDSAVVAMRKVVDLSGTDTVYSKIRQQARYNLAVIAIQHAQNTDGAAKTEQLTQSKALLQAFLKETPGDANATQALARTLQMSGDTTAIQAIFGDMLAHPEKFTYMQLFEGASSAADAKRESDAIKLFENGLAKNPNYRDALYNLANVYFSMKEGEKMMPIVDRLLAIDPNSSASWTLKAAAWQLRYRAENDAVKKKAALDSLLVYVQKKDKINPSITVTSLVASRTGLSIRGNVENAAPAPGSWTIKFEFLDKDSKVVATKDLAVGPVAQGSAFAFSVTADAPGAIAYRYAPIK